MNLPHHRRYSLLSGTKHCPVRKGIKLLVLLCIFASMFWIMNSLLLAREEATSEHLARVAAEAANVTVAEYVHNELADKRKRMIMCAK